jgi:hypothetical protein
MPSIIQDLGIVETVLGDVASFAAGNPVAASIDGYGVSVQVLPDGPAAPYVVIEGSIFQILLAVIGLVGAFSAGAPIQLAVHENKTWYGVTLTPKVALK